MSQLDLLQEQDNFVFESTKHTMQPAGNVEQEIAERIAERAEFYRDMEREQDCA